MTICFFKISSLLKIPEEPEHMEYLHLGWSLEDCRESSTVEAREGGLAQMEQHTLVPTPYKVPPAPTCCTVFLHVLHVLAPTSIQHAAVVAAAQCTGKAPGALLDPLCRPWKLRPVSARPVSAPPPPSWCSSKRPPLTSTDRLWRLVALLPLEFETSGVALS